MQDDKEKPHELARTHLRRPRNTPRQGPHRRDRVLVTTILDNLADGLSDEEIVESYPSLTRESVRAALCYGAELAKERIAPLPD